MATFTLNSKKHGKQTFTIHTTDKPGYVRLNGKQICAGGKYTGSTIMANESSLESVSRAWWKAKLKNDRVNFC